MPGKRRDERDGLTGAEDPAAGAAPGPEARADAADAGRADAAGQASPGQAAGRGSSAAPARRPDSRRGPLLTFRSRIALSFVAVTLATALLFVVVQIFSWSDLFATYTRDNMESIADSAATALSHEHESRGYWSTSGLSSVLSIDRIFDGLGIQVLNAGGTIIYDNTWIQDSDISLAPDASSMVSTQVVTSTGRQVGTVNVWAMGSDVLLTPRDISFRGRTFDGMLVAAAIGVVLAAVMALLFSSWLARPVRSITRAAERIKENDLSARSGLHGTDEIGQLGETFDEMAAKYQKDRELERRLTADVAHELRTPMMAIMATVEAMQDGVLPCDQEHLALVDGEVRRLSRLVDSMLRLSRLESRSVQMDFMPTDVADLARGMCASRRALLESMGLTLAFEDRSGGRDLTAQVDHDGITQALTNILQNASRYTPPPGSVTVWVDGDDEQVRIGVTDTGVGISPENIDRVFYRFWRAEESRNRSKGGLGVGMAVTKEIMGYHQGRIDVESELGKGSTFILVVPRVHRDEPGDAR